MTLQTSTRLLRTLLATHLALGVGALTAAIFEAKAPVGPLTSADALILAVGVPALIVYFVGLVGLWLTKAWGRLAFRSPRRCSRSSTIQPTRRSFR